MTLFNRVEQRRPKMKFRSASIFWMICSLWDSGLPGIFSKHISTMVSIRGRGVLVWMHIEYNMEKVLLKSLFFAIALYRPICLPESLDEVLSFFLLQYCWNSSTVTLSARLSNSSWGTPAPLAFDFAVFR